MKKSHAAVAPITGAAGDELGCCLTARLIIKLTWVLNNNNKKGDRNKTGMGKDNTGTGGFKHHRTQQTSLSGEQRISECNKNKSFHSSAK